MSTVQTTIHAYCFNIRNEAERVAYEELCAKLSGAGLQCFVSHGGGSHYKPALDGLEVSLETNHLFDNQWNTAPIPGHSENGLRVFDWAQDANSHIGAPLGVKRGHYLDQTESMLRVRRDTLKCGYCGKQEPATSGLAFCPHCIDSAYLKEADLPLTRMRPVCESGVRAERAPLTESEAADLLPRYRSAQIHGATERGKARIAKERASIAADYTKTTRDAKTKRDGLLWLMDRGIRIDNVIFYNHTGVFSFGWRKPVDKALESALLAIVADFPFPYDIKTEDGRTLSRP